MVPVTMSRDELLMVLEDIKERVEAGDSFEGSVEYLIPEEDAPPGSFAVRASYRVGNTMGQGGLRMIGEWAEEGPGW